MARDGQSPTWSGPGARDRFAAFAFAGCDLLVEVGDDDRVLGAFGAAMPLVGSTAAMLAHRSVLDLFTPDSAPQVSAALAEMRSGARVRFAPARGRAGPHGVPLLVSGYLAPQERSVFLAISRAAGQGLARAYAGRIGSGRLLDRAGLEALARELVAEGEGAYGLTLLDIPEFHDMGEKLGVEAMESFLERLELALRDASLGRDSAAGLGQGRYALVHGNDVSSDEIRAKVAAVKDSVDPEGLVPHRATSIHLCLDCGDFASDEAIAALVHTVENFSREEAAGEAQAGAELRLSDTVKAMTAFRQMVSDGSFHLVYQPIVALRSRAVHHFECLVRLDDGDSSPSGVVSFAEDLGIIGGLDLAVMRRAVAALRTGPARNPAVRLAINVSGRTLSDPDVVRQLCAAVHEASDLSGRLLFEITESAEIANLQAADAVIQDWRSRGHAVCLDDFGAGAAAFHYLRALTVDFVKIDGLYVRDLGRSPKSVPFLRAIVQLCHDLGMDSIAEYVDSDETAALLGELGVRYGQGYLFGKPIRPPAEGPLPDLWWEAGSKLAWRDGRLFVANRPDG